MADQPSSPSDRPNEEHASEAAGRLFDRVAQGIARGAREARRVAEEQRPAAERAARDAGGQLRRAASAARPEAERLAKQARAAADATLPHIERAGRDAVGYAREHQQELGRAAIHAGRATAHAVTPPLLRPAVDAFEREIRRQPDGSEIL